MAQRPLTRWFLTPNLDGGFTLDGNGNPVLGSQVDVDAIYMTDLYFTFASQYAMPTDGVYQVHFEIDLINPASGVSFMRRWRFTKDSTKFPVITGELGIGSDWIPQPFLVQGSIGVNLLENISLAGEDPLQGPVTQGPGTYTLTENFYSDDGSGDLTPLMDPNIVHTYDLRVLQILNFQATPNRFNIDTDDNNKTTISGDLSALPVVTTLYPDGWYPSVPVPTRAGPVGHDYIDFTTTVTAPDTSDPNGIIGSFAVDWDGFLTRYGEDDQPDSTFPADTVVQLIGLAAAPLDGGGAYLTNQPQTQVVVACCRCELQALDGFCKASFGFSMLESPFGPPLVCASCYCGLNKDHMPTSMGYGWASAGATVTELDNGDLCYRGDGSGTLRWLLTNGAYVPSREDNYVLAAKDASNMETPYQLTFPDQTRQLFGSDGKIVSEVDTRGQTRSYTYASGQVDRITDASGRFQAYSYGDRTDGQPVQIQAFHPSDSSMAVRTVTFTYYADDDPVSPNRLQSMTAEGIETTFTYDANGLLINQQDPVRQVSYAYDAYGRVSGEIHAGVGDTPVFQLVRSYFFNDSAAEVRIAEWDSFSPSGQADLPRLTVLNYGARGMIVSSSELYSGGTVDDFDPFGGGSFNQTTMEYQDIHETDTTFVSNPYLVTQQVDPNGAITNMTYNLQGNLSTLTDAQGNVTKYYYGADLYGPTAPFPNHLYQIQRPNVTVDGQLTWYNPIYLEYDSYGSLIGVTDSLGQQTSFGLNDQGQIVSITDRLGHVTTFTYGTYGNLATVTTPGGPGSAPARTTTFEYDTLDNLHSVTDPLGNVWSYLYDDGDRLTQATDPSGQQVLMTYLDGLLQQIQSPPNQGSGGNRRNLSLSYDSYGRMDRVDADISTSAQQMRVRYEFTGFSTLRNLVRLMNSAEKSTNYQRDRLGRTTSVTDPLERTTAVEYAPYCTENTVTTARGILRQYTYDTLCQLTQVAMGTSLDTPDETRQFTYDELGRLTRVRQIMGSGQARYGQAHYGLDRYGTGQEDRLFEYDPLDRLTKVTFPDGNTLLFEYDAEDNLIQMIDMSGAITQYEYYNDNRLYKVIVQRANQANRVFTYRYDAAGRPTEIRYPSSTGIVARFTDLSGNPGWDVNGRLTYLRYLKNGNHLHSFAYSYDAAGNRTQMVDTPTDTSQVKTWDYAYDWLNRLSSVSLNSAMHTIYGYDESDNRVSIEWPDLSQTHVYTLDVADQMVSRALNGDEAESFSYDQDGNMTSRTMIASSMTTTYSWSADDRLVTFTLPDSSVAQERYDAEGIRKAGPDGTQYFSSAGMSLYDVRPSGPVAFIQGHQLLGLDQGGSLYYYIADGLSSVREIVDESGTSVASYEHEAFGEPLNYSGTGDLAHTYVGALGVRNETASSGLLLMRQRWYDPALGRFLNRDPIGYGGGLNVYGYAGNNPSTKIDPSGLNDQTWQLQHPDVTPWRGWWAETDLLRNVVFQLTVGKILGNALGALLGKLAQKAGACFAMAADNLPGGFTAGTQALRDAMAALGRTFQSTGPAAEYGPLQGSIADASPMIIQASPNAARVVLMEEFFHGELVQLGGPKAGLAAEEIVKGFLIRNAEGLGLNCADVTALRTTLQGYRNLHNAGLPLWPGWP